MAMETLGDKIRVTQRSRNQRRNRNRNRFQLPRDGRDGHLLPTGGIDFSGCTTDPDTGFCCVEVEETTKTVKRDPILECTHRDEEKCHYTYVTQFTPTAEEICEENFEKLCQITFKQEATEEQVEKCYRPLIKNCNGQGEEVCQTMFESSCTTKYIEKQPGKFVGDTKCEKLPVDICGAGCVVEEGPEECFDKTVLSLLDVPEEICDLNPQKTCKFQTRLVPKLKPEHECTIIPRETCFLKFTNPEQVDQPLKTKWCQDPSPPTPGETYSESGAQAPPVSERGGRAEAALPPPSPSVAQNNVFGPQFSNQNGFSQDNQIAPAQQNVGLSQQQLNNQNAFRQQNGLVNQQQFSPVFDQGTGNQNNFRQQFGGGFSQQQSNNVNGFNSIVHVQDNAPFRDNFNNFNQGRHSQGVFSNGNSRQQFRRGRMASHDENEVDETIPIEEEAQKIAIHRSEGETTDSV